MIVRGVGRAAAGFLAAGVAAVVALAGCATPSSTSAAPPRFTPGLAAAGSTPSPTVSPTAAASSRGVVPTPRPPTTTTTHPPTRAVPGDLTIHLVGNSCGYFLDGHSDLALAPTLQVGWVGPVYFPTGPEGLRFSMTTNFGQSASGQAISTAPFTWTIAGQYGPGNPWLGHTVIITVTIDSTNIVKESNESNNTATITVPVPNDLPLPVSGVPPAPTIPCHE